MCENSSVRRALAFLLLVALSAHAERLYVCGFELQTTRDGVETDEGVGADGGTFIDASPAHGGVAVARAVAIPGMRSSFRHFFESSTPAMFARVYVRLEQLPTTTTMFLLVRRSSAVPAIAWLTVDSTGTVRPQVWVSAFPAQVRLTVGQWHRFDIFVDERGASGTHLVQIAFDGQPFVFAPNLALSHIVDTIEVGLNVNQEAAGNGVMLFDDLAVNGTVGTAENSFPGPGRLFLQQPAGPTTAFQWTPTDGGLPSTDNWRAVSELPPDDDGSGLISTNNNANADEYLVTAPPVDAFTSTVRLVAAGARFRGDNTTNRAVGVSLRSGPGGMLAQSADLSAATLAWRSNRFDGYLNVPLVASTTPEGVPWTGTSLSTMQLGLFDADSVARPVLITNVWAYVELVAASEPPPPVPGVGPADAGTSFDAGVTGDAGTTVDAGTPSDAGEVDAGGPREDAGSGTDGGAGDDAGLMTADASVNLDGGFELDDGGLFTEDGGLRPRWVLPVGCACSESAGLWWVMAAVLLRRRRVSAA